MQVPASPANFPKLICNPYKIPSTSHVVTVVAPCSVMVKVGVAALRGIAVTVVAPRGVAVAVVAPRGVTVTSLCCVVPQSWSVVAVIAITVVTSSLHVIAIMPLLSRSVVGL